MKVTGVRVLGKNLPMTLVEVHGESGLIGIGGCEAPVSVIRPILEQPPWKLADLVIGREVSAIEQIWKNLTEAIEIQGGPLVRAAAALDMALWDLAGKAENLPLYKMIGAAVQSGVTAYASGTAYDLTNYQPGIEPPLKSPQRLAIESRECVKRGFTAVKFGWGDHFAPADEERLAAIREAIGPQTRLMIDFGCPAYFGSDVSPANAIKIAHCLAKYSVYFLEEPLLPHDAEGHAEVSRASRILIASGEMLCHEYEFDRFFKLRTVGVIQPDAYRIGITQTLHVARKANELGILCVPHSPWSALAVAAHVHVSATIAGGAMVEFPAPSLYHDTLRHGEVTRLSNEEITTSALQPRQGVLPLPQSPGLGLGQFKYDTIARIEALAEKGLER